eukprot:1139343-Amphidinium_carterae.2
MDTSLHVLERGSVLTDRSCPQAGTTQLKKPTSFAVLAAPDTLACKRKSLGEGLCDGQWSLVRRPAARLHPPVLLQQTREACGKWLVYILAVA